ncbi:MAG: hypothetical protein K2N73_07925 [Lachnospiraceae bacterium]|nr:hypothetical protein [Lachnospiraceae bacterium]
MFRRKLFKHALLKHALPIILSVAMAFQSMPATALASESQTVEDAVLNENTQAHGAGEAAGNVPETDAEQDTAAETVTGSESDTPVSDGKPESEEESGQQVEESDAGEMLSTAVETATVETAITDTENMVEIAAEDETPNQSEENAKNVAKIIVDDKKADAYAQTDNGFTRVLGEKDLHFCTEYVQDSKCSDFQQAVDSWIRVEVDGETIDTLKDRLTYSWVRKAEAEGETDTPLVNAFPKDAGDYVLTVSMDLSNLDGLCKKLESDLTVSLTIEKADVGIVFDKTTAPGKTAAEFIDTVNKNYTVSYKDKKYDVSRDILVTKDAEGKDDPDKKLPLYLYVIDENGARKPMDALDKFARDKDYVLTIGSVGLAENASGNYKLSVNMYYIIEVDERQKTEVRFSRKDAGEDLIQVYVPEKAWAIDEVTKDLFTEAVTDESGTVTKASGVPTVFVLGKDGESDRVLDGAALEAKWYTRIRLNSGSAYDVDEEAGEIKEGQWYIYKPMDLDPVDAGEYYIIWSYAGDDGAYEKSHSEAVRFTVDPAPVVIRVNPESLTTANFRDGMAADDVTKALSEITYGVYPLVKNETAGIMEAGSTALEISPDFWGTSYSGNVTDTDKDKTQYYVPEFILERRIVEVTYKDQEPVDVDPETVIWEEVTGALKVVVDDAEELKACALPHGVKANELESAAFAFRVRFTGNKVLYDNDGSKLQVGNQKIPITDVTTNSANKNYLADITTKTLEDTAMSVPVEGMRTESVQIVTDSIVDAFKTDNKDMLDSGAADDIRQGTLENPAVKIYDQSALFRDRASYKQAKIHKFSADGGIGDALPVLPTDDSLSYTWSYTTLDKYEAYLEKWDEVQRQYIDFNAYDEKNSDKLGWTDAADGSFDTFKNAGLYRLTVVYNDPEYVYQSAETEVFFKVARQEVVVVPAERYVKDGENILTMAGGLGKVNTVDFTIYKLPHNSMDAYNALTDAEKKSYVLPTEEEIADYEMKNGHKPEMNLDSLTWQVMRKEKDPVSGQDKEPAEWILADGVSFDADFTYGIAARWTGSIDWLAGADYNYDSNYTTRDEKTYKLTGEEKHYESVSAVRFYDQQIYVEVDAEKIKALGHVYDGEPVDLKAAAQALRFYTDEALTEDSRLSTENIVNTDEGYDPAKINIYWIKNGKWYANKNAVYGGIYTLGLRYEGGELKTSDAADTAQENAASMIYAPLSDNGQKVCADMTFTVSPREITATPKTLPADILYAGEKADALLTEEIDIQGIVGKDQKYFDYAEIAAGDFDICWDGKNEDGTDKESPVYIYKIDKKGGYPAFNGAAAYIIQTDDREIREADKEYLRFGSKYTIKLTNDLVSPLKESYSITYGTAEVRIEKRGSADITAISATNTLSAKGIGFELTDGTYTIRPRGAIKFFDNASPQTVIGRNGNEILKNANILGFRIYAPKEFMNDFRAAKANFVYQNAIWNAGGYFRSTAEWNNNSGYVDVVFPLTQEDTVKSFCITWEDGYTENFTLADIVLEEDFTKAVAPKSIAFNGVSSKMAVGERQQLNLKITKAQLGDVITIRYRIKGGETKNEYISIDPETGAVTALKVGKAATIVEAYPVYKNAKGDFVPVRDSKGKEAKAASAKITVREVTASAVKKITVLDESVKLYFTVPDDGYRREIYVVDVTKGTEYESRKKWKPDDFDKAIDDVKNGQWKAAGFAVKPVYTYVKNKDLDAKEIRKEYDKKLKAHIQKIAGIEAGHEYAIYVRNVSAARTLDDGSAVTLSTSGVVRSFKTTKPQVQGLELDFTVKTSDSDKKNTVTHPVNPDGTIDVDAYTVELSAKKAQLNVYGYFSDRAGGNDAAEEPDQRRYSLVPVLKEEKAALKNYLLPKLSYTMYDSRVSKPFQPGLEQSKYAQISNKGVITLKGVDLNGRKTVYIYVRDNTQHEDDYGYDAQIALTITAEPASFTGKKVKMTVGQTIKLSDCLAYRDAKKKKIPAYRSCGVTITKEMLAAAKANGYEITDVGGSKLAHDWEITAVSPNKAAFDLAVTDFDADGSQMETTVKLTAAQIGAVKALKVTYVDNRYITINFTHSANSNEADDGRVYDYALEVKDARGNVVDKIVLSNPHRIFDIDNVNAKELKNALSWIQYTKTDIDEATGKMKVDGNSARSAFNYYTGTRTKTKTFAYTYYNEKIVKLSSYTISVTPLYKNQKADKTATVRTKTTNTPASYHNVDLTGDVEHRLGGYDIKINSSQLHKDDLSQNNNGKSITIPYRFISGNIYTLSLGTYIATTKDRASDPLVWKSSNTKVATVKANPGTYYATFKALNQGTTTISLTSTVTKKVIARWKVTVYAVKDGSGYGGDYEPAWVGFYEKILALYDPDYEGRLEVLSENVPLVISNEDEEIETWVSFTAPHYGRYHFKLNNANFYGPYYDSSDGRKIANGASAIYLEKNQKIYCRVKGNGTLTVAGSELVRLTKAHTKEAPLEIKAESYVTFTAWEDNVYTFYLNGRKHSDAGLKAGETHIISVPDDGSMYVTCREETAAEELKLGSHPTGTVELDKDNQIRYISFTAGTTGVYTFAYKETDGVEVNFSTAAGGEPVRVEPDISNGTEGTIKSFRLEEGEKLVIAFMAVPEITDAEKRLTVSVTVTGAEQRRKIENASITIPKGTTEIVEYAVPSFTTEKAQFRFQVTGEGGTRIEKYFNRDYHTVNVKGARLTVSKSSDVKAGDSIYIQVTAGDGGAEAKDAVLTVTQVPVGTLTDSASVIVDNNTEQWYTFTAAKDGYYAFGLTVAEKAGEDKAPTHDAFIDICKELFGSSDVADYVTTEKILFMKTGEKLALKLDHDTLADIVKDDGTTEAVQSNVTVSVNALDIQRLVLDAEEAVGQIAADSKEVRYYSFTAAAKADYTILWNAADAAKDNAKITFLTSVESQRNGSKVLGRFTKTMNAGEVCYIRVEPNDPQSGNPVSGTLRITAANLSADVLTAGTPYPFTLEDKDGKGAEKVVRFTAEESGFYEIVTTAYENPASGLPYAYPALKTTDGSLTVPYASVRLEKGETRYFTLSFSANGSEVKETKGAITINSAARPLLGDQTDVSVPKDIVEEYTYTIPETGRYEFGADYDKQKASVLWNYADGSYLMKNTKVKATVIGLDGDADASVKLYKPVLIHTNLLNAGANPIAIEAGKTQYYELRAEVPAQYSFDISAIEDGKAGISMRRAMNNETAWSILSDGASVSMAKNDRMIIKMSSSSVKKDASCVLNVTANTELKLGENPIHLEPGASIGVTYYAHETGYYSFNLNQPGAQLVLKTDSSMTVGDDFYDIVKLNAKAARSYIVANEGNSAVDFIAIMKAVEPIVLDPGKDEPEASDVSIDAGEWAHFLLKTFKKGAYTIKIADDGKGDDLNIYLDGSNVTTSLKKVTDGIYLEKDLSGETLLRIQNDGIQETKVTVSVAACEVQPLTQEPVTISRNESMLVSFVAAEKNRYIVSKDNKHVTMTLVSKNGVPGTGEVIDYKEEILEKGDKLIYRLAYEPAETDKNAESEQTAGVKIAAVQPVVIEEESTSVTIAENDNMTVWYQFTAKEDATYTFALKDSYNDEDIRLRCTFYQYITDESYRRGAEWYLKAGEKVFVKAEYDVTGTHTLTYTMMKAATETGTMVLDFANANEEQEVKFVASRGGIYKITASAIRGRFMVAGRIGNKEAFETFHSSGSTETVLLKQGDIMTMAITANSSGKSSVSLRIEEVSVADTLEPGREVSGLSDKAKDRYYEMRVKEKALYAVTAGGEPEVTYTCTRKGSEENETELDGTDYVELDVDDRIILKVAKTNPEKLYTVKIEKVDVVSLDGKNTEENPFTVSETEGTYYGFTTEKAYIRYTVLEDGDYYAAVQTVNDAAVYDGHVINAPTARTGAGEAGMQSLKAGQTVTFAFTNSMPKDESAPDKDYQEAVFRFTLKKAAAASDNVICAGEPQSGTLGANESISFQFTAAEAGKYAVSFKGSNCTLNGAWNIGKTFRKDESLTLTVENTSEKAGSYELTVTRLDPVALTLGVPAQTRLDKGEAVLYAFTAAETENSGTTYQIYTDKAGYQYSITGADGVMRDEGYNSSGHMEQLLMENEKIELVIENKTTQNYDVGIAVKKVEYIPVKNGEAVSGALEKNEKAYYEFTSEDESADGTEYRVALDNDNVEFVRMRVAEIGEDGNLGEPAGRYESPVVLKKGDKLLMEVRGVNGQSGSFNLIVEKAAVPEIPYEPIALNETKIGKLAADERAGYEFTAADAVEDGTLYSVYFNGAACSYSWTTAVTDADGTAKEEVTSGTLDSGSNAFTWKKGDKIRFTASKSGKYELTVKKVTYEPLTLGTAVSKTLRAKETVYYQFTAQDEPEAGGTETMYQVYGTANYTVSKVTVNEDNTTTAEPLRKMPEYCLKKGQSLQFTVTNGKSAASTVQLTIKKAVYSPMALGKPEEGRLNDGERAYYQFTAQDEPAEGETTTRYHVYGDADYTVKRVTVNEDNTTTVTILPKAPEYDLGKGQSLQFTVTGSGSSQESYYLTIVKYEERKLTIGSITETGSLGKGQNVVYVFQYDGETLADYTVSFKQMENVTVTVKRNGSVLHDVAKRISLSKGDTLTITVSAADEADNFTFSVGRLIPEMMTLGAMTDLRKLSADETVYYQYTVGENGSYVISMTKSSDDALALDYEVTKADGTGVVTGTAGDGIKKIDDLKKDDVLLFSVSAPGLSRAAAYSFRLLLQKADADESITALPWRGVLQSGEVRHFRFTVPEAEKEDTHGYFVIITGSSDKIKYCCGDSSALSGAGFIETAEDLELIVANTSMYSAADCKIEVHRKEPLGMGTYTGTLEPGAYKYFTFPGMISNGEAIPYYFKNTSDSKCVIERRIEDNEWVSCSTNTYSEPSPFVVRVRNKDTEKAAAYIFELRNVWQDDITDVFQKDYYLEEYEVAYFSVTAPADKILYVSIVSDLMSWWTGTEKTDVRVRVEKEAVYGVEPGETRYFKVNNEFYASSFTLKVTGELDTIPLQLDTGSITYIPAGQKALYEFEAPDEGDYIVFVDGSIQNVSHQYMINDGVEDEKTLESNDMFHFTANSMIALSVENQSSSAGSRSCRVQIVKITPMELNVAKEVFFGTYGQVYCFAVPADVAGDYTINGQVLESGKADFCVKCLNDIGSFQTNIYNNSGHSNKDLPVVQMEAGGTIYIRVWPYYAGRYGSLEQYNERITITVTSTPASENN